MFCTLEYINLLILQIKKGSTGMNVVLLIQIIIIIIGY